MFLRKVMSKFLFLLLLISSISIASEVHIVDRFIELSDKTKVVGATQTDINAVAELLSEEMRYQHPNYNADLSKAEFIDGLRRYMGAAETQSTTVTNRINGDKAVAIAYISTTVIDGRTEVDSTPLMRLIEFKDGKIVLIREYW
jgi:hypothetical protein